MANRKPSHVKKIVAVIFAILFLDTLLVVLQNISQLSLEVLGFNVGFTFLVLVVTSFIVLKARKRLKVDDAVMIGAGGLLARSILSIPIASFFGTTYPFSFIALLSLRNLILGLCFGAFAGWLADKVIK